MSSVLQGSVMEPCLLPQRAESLTRRREDKAYVSERFGVPMHLLTDEERKLLPLWHCEAIYEFRVEVVDAHGAIIR